MGRKRCRECGAEKPLDDFFRHARSADGHRKTCIACHRGPVRTEKRCNVCGVTKTLAEFNRSNKSPDGRQYTCKPCGTERAKNWASEHPDRHREIMRNYTHTERYRETRKAYRDREREAIRTNRTGWYARNREEILARRRERDRGNPLVREQSNERSRRWVAKNRRRVFLYHLKYEYGLTEDQWSAMVVAQGGCCAICGKPADLRVDHEHAVDGRVRGLLCDLCNRGIGHFRDNPEFLTAAARYLQSS